MIVLADILYIYSALPAFRTVVLKLLFGKLWHEDILVAWVQQMEQVSVSLFQLRWSKSSQETKNRHLD